MRGRATAAGGVRFKFKKDPKKKDRRELETQIYEAVKDQPAVVALQEGRLQDIGIENVSTLFKKLTLEGNTLPKYDVVQQLLVLCLELSDGELDEIRTKMGVQLHEAISPQKFFNVLNKPVIQTLIKQAHRDKTMRASHSDEEKKLLVRRNFFQAKVAWRVNRDDAFSTLPTTGCYMTVFMILVVYHLQIWKRQEVERGIETWIEKQGELYYGPFILEHVYGIDTFAKWLHVSGLPGIFRNTEDHAGGVEVRMGHSNIVVGDVFLRQNYGDDYSEKSSWLLSTANATEYMQLHAGSSQRYLGLARQTAQHLLNSSHGWVSEETKKLSLFFHTYNNQAGMYARTEVLLRLDRFGHVRPVIKSIAIMVFPYQFPVIYIFDGLYCLIMLRTLWMELKDMCTACALGFGEFLDYWTVWNAIDWASMTLGFANVALWVCICLLMQADSLHSLLDDSQKMGLNTMSLSVSELEQLHSDLDRVYKMFVTLHLTTAATAIFIILKFFKGFQANPRLQTMTKTISIVSLDVFHFLVVFVAIFASFAVIGHVLFGADLPMFYTLGASFNIHAIVLMGEFDWYSELSDMPDIFTSGMPRFMLVTWFAIYVMFVVLVMLNMLLALILQRHSEVAHGLTSRQDARTIWAQAIRWTKRKIDTRGFIPLYRIRRLLENDNNPAHPKEFVSEGSLMEAFPGMTTAQASYMMEVLEDELGASLLEDFEDEDVTRAKRTERFIQSISEELHIVDALVTDTRERLCQFENAFCTIGFRQMRARARAQAGEKIASSNGSKSPRRSGLGFGEYMGRDFQATALREAAHEIWV